MLVLRQWALIVLISSVSVGQNYGIRTLVGGGEPQNVDALSVAFTPTALAYGADGSLIVADHSRVYRVTSDRRLSVIAGKGIQLDTFSTSVGDRGQAKDASFSDIYDLAVDGQGNIFIAERWGARIRRVDAQSGIITTVVFTVADAIAANASGDLFYSEYNSSKIVRVPRGGTAAPFAGTGAYDFYGDGGAAGSAAFRGICGLAFDATGNLIVGDLENRRIRRISAGNGTITTISGGGVLGSLQEGQTAVSQDLYGCDFAPDLAGNIFVPYGNALWRVSSDGRTSRFAGSGVSGFSGDGGPSTNALFNLRFFRSVVTDREGNVYLADSGNRRVRRISISTSLVSTYAGGGPAGDGGQATQATLNRPSRAAFDSAGRLVILDSGNLRIRRVDLDSGAISALAGTGYESYIDDGGQATSAPFTDPFALGADSAENVYVGEFGRIRRISTSGQIRTITGELIQGGASGRNGEGIPTTAAFVAGTTCIAVDQQNVYYGESGYLNDGSSPAVSRIRKVDASGLVTTIAGGTSGYSGDGGPAITAQFSGIFDCASDGRAGLYVVDGGNSRIRLIDLNTGLINTFAGNGQPGRTGDGGLATRASFGDPISVTVDAEGNVFVGALDGTVRRIAKTTGIVQTIAGTGTTGVLRDAGLATSAWMGYPSGLITDRNGRIYLVDMYATSVRVLNPIESQCAFSLSQTTWLAGAAGGSLDLGIQTDSSCAWSVADLPSWITLAGANTGTGSRILSLTVLPNHGAPRSIQISIAGIAVTINQVSSELLITPGGVVNAASYTAPVAPGSIAAIFGNFLLPSPLSASSFPLPTDLGGLAFQFAGAPPPPLFYANFGQANGQVPWELAGQSQTTITATKNSQITTPQTARLSFYAPGIFAQNGQGTGQGSILDANYRLTDVTNPATAGRTTVLIFCTGLGPVTNRPTTGAVAPRNPLSETTLRPTVTIGGAPANVQFSGLAPGYVGLYQVNALVPSAAAKGNAVSVSLSMLGVQSNTVTIAVQ